MKTPKAYVEIEGKKPFNWNKVFKMKVPKNYSWEFESKLDEYADLAGGWTTCACGNQCAIIPRDEDGEPKDSRLSSLGRDFYDAIADAALFAGNSTNMPYDETRVKNGLGRAKLIMEKIEARSFKLIVKELDKLNKSGK